MKHLRPVGRQSRPAPAVAAEVILTVLMQFIEAVRTLLGAKEPVAEGEGEGEGEG